MAVQQVQTGLQAIGLRRTPRTSPKGNRRRPLLVSCRSIPFKPRSGVDHMTKSSPDLAKWSRSYDTRLRPGCARKQVKACVVVGAVAPSARELMIN